MGGVIVELKEYQNHVRRAKKELKHLSWCGEEIIMLWVFQDVDHVLHTLENEGRLVPCPACWRAIMAIMNKAVSD